MIQIFVNTFFPIHLIIKPCQRVFPLSFFELLLLFSLFCDIPCTSYQSQLSIFIHDLHKLEYRIFNIPIFPKLTDLYRCFFCFLIKLFYLFSVFWINLAFVVYVVHISSYRFLDMEFFIIDYKCIFIHKIFKYLNPRIL